MPTAIVLLKMLREEYPPFFKDMQLTSFPFFSEILILQRGHRTKVTRKDGEGSLGSNTLL